MTTNFGVRSSLRSAAARRIEAAGRAFERSQESGVGDQVPGVGTQVSAAEPPIPDTQHRGSSPGQALKPEPPAPDTRHLTPEPLAPDTWHLISDRRPGQCRRIIEEVAAKYDVPVKDILSDRRAKVLIGPRHEAMYRCVAETPLSLPAIGRVFHRDHTSIGHGVMRHHLRSGDPLPRGMDWQAGRRKRR